MQLMHAWSQERMHAHNLCRSCLPQDFTQDHLMYSSLLCECEFPVGAAECVIIIVDI